MENAPHAEAVEQPLPIGVQETLFSTQTANNEQIFLTAEGHFDAAHNLVNYVGKCSDLHGHRWVVKAEFGPFTEDELDGSGIALDFKDIRLKLNAIIDVYDHKYLNNFFDLPSAEKIALQIFRSMKKFYPDKLFLIEVYESPESKCTVKNGS